jgi:hypothetical protein
VCCLQYLTSKATRMPRCNRDKRSDVVCEATQMDKLCLPTDVWTTVHQKLCRDDVCAAAQVWPGSIDDPILNTFTPGGIPVCVDCAQKCGLQAYDLCTTKKGFI